MDLDELKKSQEYTDFVSCREGTKSDFLSIQSISTLSEYEKINTRILTCLRTYNSISKLLIDSPELEEAAKSTASRLLLTKNTLDSFRKKDVEALAKNYIFHESVLTKENELWAESIEKRPSVFSETSMFSIIIIFFILFSIYTKFVNSGEGAELDRATEAIKNYNKYISKKLGKGEDN